MNSEFEHRRESLILLIDNSSLPDTTKLLYRQIANHAADGTNGLTEKEKLQNVSETCFSLTELNIARDCHQKSDFDHLIKKLDVISERLNANDKLTLKLDEEEKHLKEKINEEIKSVGEKLDKIVPDNESVIIKDQQPRGKLDLLSDLFKKIGWPGAFTIVGVIGIIALRPEIVKALHFIFQ